MILFLSVSSVYITVIVCRYRTHGRYINTSYLKDVLRFTHLQRLVSYTEIDVQEQENSSFLRSVAFVEHLSIPSHVYMATISAYIIL
jgi:hypothetical protein